MSIKTQQEKIIKVLKSEIEVLKSDIQVYKVKLIDEKYLSKMYKERLDKLNTLLGVEPDYAVTRLMHLLEKESQLDAAIKIAENVR